MKFWIAAFFALTLTTSSSTVFAYESESDAFGYHDPLEESSHTHFNINQSDATRVQKFEAALDTLGIPLEQAPDFNDFVHANEANQTEVQNNLPFIDPDQGLARYISLVNGNLQMFRDFFKSMISLDYLEYQQTLSTDNPSNDSSDLIQRLKRIALQVQANDSLSIPEFEAHGHLPLQIHENNSLPPLYGLKVLIDPGHMGGDQWDHDTGKYVAIGGGWTYKHGQWKFSGGRKVSEGDLNLWTSLLTAKKLEALGAIVKITREHQGSVSSETMETFDSIPYLHSYFHTSMDGWMAPYLVKSIDQIRSTIKAAPEVSKAYSQLQRNQFFITGEDMVARSKIIDAFNPDITLDIHFDAANNTATQNTTQSLEAFVPGGFLKTETGGRKTKALALKHLLEVRRWNQSIELADQMTRSMSSALKIKRLTTPQAFSAIRVRDGVYARNLYITRNVLSSLVVYLECLHYDHVKEHRALSVRDQIGDYHSISFQYPKRLNTVSDGITRGLLDYFRNLK